MHIDFTGTKSNMKRPEGTIFRANIEYKSFSEIERKALRREGEGEMGDKRGEGGGSLMGWRGR